MEKAISIEPSHDDVKALLEQFKVRAAAAEAERVKLADEEEEEERDSGGEEGS